MSKAADPTKPDHLDLKKEKTRSKPEKKIVALTHRSWGTLFPEGKSPNETHSQEASPLCL